MTASPFRSVSPKGKDTSNQQDVVNKFGQSMGTTSAASLRQDGRDNPFNQVVHVASSASRRENRNDYTPVAGETVSGCSSAIRRMNEPSYFSNIKENNSQAQDAYRTYDPRRDGDGNDPEADDHISRSEYIK